MLYICTYVTCFSISLIVNLTNRQKVIEEESKQSQSVSFVTEAAGDIGKLKVTSHHHQHEMASSDQSSDSISLPDSQDTVTWQMPFTLKCIGTFMLVQTLEYCIYVVKW